jgi:2,5-diketo-D-gluconate reductase A
MTTPVVHTYTLDEGNTIPSIGFGTWPLKDEGAEQAVRSAIELGYRLIDSATN